MTTSSKTPIFQQLGVATRSTSIPGYITIQAHPAGDLIVLSGPVIKALIQRNVDTGMHKTGRNNFVLQSFGHFPVGVTITGITLLRGLLQCSGQIGLSLREFYRQYNIGDALNVNKRVRVVVDNTVYECCVIGFALLASQGSVMAQCTLSLIGAVVQ